MVTFCLQTAPGELLWVLTSFLLEEDVKQWWMRLCMGTASAEEVQIVKDFRDAWRCMFIPKSAMKEDMPEIRNF